MTTDSDPPPLTPGEFLARFITVHGWIRADQTIRQDAFIPPKDLQLSVTRHNELSERELWDIGNKVAKQVAGNMNATALGRADIRVSNVMQNGLRAELAPVPDNPHHVHILDWPEDKSARKNRAQQLAAAAGKAIFPSGK